MGFPKDDDMTMHLNSGSHGGIDYDLSEILDKVKEKWPDASLDNVKISAKHIQFRCFGYDLYDSSDYETYIVITYNP